MVWRGPMVTQALEQLLRDTNWRELDYLIVDMPPGTGDIQLTLAQKVPVTGAVIVTTPQDIALIDARKGLKMFEKVRCHPRHGREHAVHVCSNCGHAEHIFGSGGGARWARSTTCRFWAVAARYPHPRAGRRGTPTVVADPDGEIAACTCDIARKTAARRRASGRGFSRHSPRHGRTTHGSNPTDGSAAWRRSSA